MGTREFSRWMEFEKLEPFGPAREDLRAGVIACMLSTTKGVTPETFFPNLREEAEPEDRDAAILAALMGMVERG